MKVKNWQEFQHYKDRAPPWVKLHKTLLDDYEYQSLPVASRALAPMLWLLASENIDGVFDGSIPKLAFRLRCSEKEIKDGLIPLINNGFIIDDSNSLAQCYQDDIPETETETETEAKTETQLCSKKTKKTKKIEYEDYPEFAEFWCVYPNKSGKYNALVSWSKAKPSIQDVMNALNWQVDSEQWRKDGGQYVPMAATYLNQKRWQDEPPDDGRPF